MTDTNNGKNNIYYYQPVILNEYTCCNVTAQALTTTQPKLSDIRLHIYTQLGDKFNINETETSALAPGKYYQFVDNKTKKGYSLTEETWTPVQQVIFQGNGTSLSPFKFMIKVIEYLHIRVDLGYRWMLVSISQNALPHLTFSRLRNETERLCFSTLGFFFEKSYRGMVWLPEEEKELNILLQDLQEGRGTEMDPLLIKMRSHTIIDFEWVNSEHLTNSRMMIQADKMENLTITGLRRLMGKSRPWLHLLNIEATTKPVTFVNIFNGKPVSIREEDATRVINIIDTVNKWGSTDDPFVLRVQPTEAGINP